MSLLTDELPFAGLQASLFVVLSLQTLNGSSNFSFLCNISMQSSCGAILSAAKGRETKSVWYLAYLQVSGSGRVFSAAFSGS